MRDFRAALLCLFVGSFVCSPKQISSEKLLAVWHAAPRAANGLCNVWVHRQSAKTYGWTDQWALKIRRATTARSRKFMLISRRGPIKLGFTLHRTNYYFSKLQFKTYWQKVSWSSGRGKPLFSLYSIVWFSKYGSNRVERFKKSWCWLRLHYNGEAVRKSTNFVFRKNGANL
jgi:hypothetical protein